MIHRTFEFDSLSALAAYVQDAPNDSRADESTDWNGNVTFERALELARHGWPEGAERARKMSASMHSVEARTAHVDIVQTQHDVSGSYVDVGRYVEGEPECMVDFRPNPKPFQFVRIVVHASVRASVTPEALMCRGMAVCALVDALEARNIRCDVEAVTYAHDEPSKYATTSCRVSIILKRAHEPLQLEQLAFALAHASFHRRLIFGLMDKAPEVRPQFFGHYGLSYDFTPPSDALYIPMTKVHDAAWKSDRGAVEFINTLTKGLVP